MPTTRSSSPDGSKAEPTSRASRWTIRTSSDTSRRPDFFDAERFPQLRFVSSSIERDGDVVSIAGDLTLRGETRPVELAGTIAGPITDGYGKQRLGLDLETTINRRDFGIDWSAELPGGDQMLADDVLITANLALVQS